MSGCSEADVVWFYISVSGPARCGVFDTDGSGQHLLVDLRPIHRNDSAAGTSCHYSSNDSTNF